MIVPVTRKEKLLNAIATNGNVDFSPKTREELFLFKILGADVNAPTPITRKELLYQHIIDGTLPTFEPRTRLEKFIMAAAGVELELPVVLTREEYWWAEISDSAYETITGAIVHFISKRARAIKSLIANISYTQDLNGYSYPWPAGGGKNVLPTPTEAQTVNGVTATPNADGSITLTGTASAIAYFDLITGFDSTAYAGYIVTGLPDDMASNSSTICYRISTASSRASLQDIQRGASGTYVNNTIVDNGTNLVFSLRVNNGYALPAGGLTLYPMMRASSASADFEPYANICPISGWTGANIANISDSTMQLYFAGLLNGDYGFVDLGTLDWTYNNATSTPIFSIKVVDINAKPNSSDFICLGYTSKLRFWTEANNDKCIGSGNSNFNISNFAYNDAITFKSAMSGVYLIYKNKTPTAPTITPTQYNTLLSSFNVSGWLVPIFWQAAAGTVYGGTLDIVTGELTVTSAKITPVISDYQSINSYGIVNWRIRTPNCTNYDGKHGSNALQQQTSTIADTKNEGFYISSSTYSYIRLLSSRATTSAEANQVIADNGVYIVYELAEPVTYQLTPTEVATLLGENTIWADTGDVTVTY